MQTFRKDYNYNTNDGESQSSFVFVVDNRTIGCVSKTNTRAKNIEIISQLESLVPNEELPEAQRLAWVRACKEQRDYFDKIHPSPWEGPVTSRGWKYTEEAFYIEGRYVPYVRVWYPIKYEVEIRIKKGVCQGNLVDRFITRQDQVKCQNIVLLPGNGVAVMDMGTQQCNYGIRPAEIPQDANIEVLFANDPEEEYAVYNPTVWLMIPGFIPKEKSPNFL